MIFVHGLNGSGYETWGQFPELLFDETDVEVDVGLFDYPSGLRRFRRKSHAAGMDTVENLLMAELLDLTHQTVILIAHSMGGIVALGALQRLLTTAPGDRTPSARFGVVLMASPRAGSRRVPKFVWTKDARYLRTHAKHLVDIDRFVTRSIESSASEATSKPHRIPLYAALATNDRWVDDFSASFSIPERQSRPFPGNHTSIVKPSGPESAVYKWTLRAIVEISSAPGTTTQRGPRTVRLFNSGIVVEFLGHALESQWSEAYTAATTIVQDEKDTPIIDSTYAPREVSTEVRIRVVRADSVSLQVTSDELQQDDLRQRNMEILHLAISPYGGSTVGDVCDKIHKLIGSSPDGRQRWIAHTSSYIELRDQMVRWLSQVVDMRTSSPIYSLRSEIRDEALIESEAGSRQSSTRLFRSE